MKEDSPFSKRLLATFKVEAEGRLNAMSTIISACIESKKNLEALDFLKLLCRELHSLRGAARSVSLGEVEHLCLLCESVLVEIIEREIPAFPAFFDTLRKSIDQLACCVEDGVAERVLSNPVQFQQVFSEVQQQILLIKSLKNSE